MDACGDIVIGDSSATSAENAVIASQTPAVRWSLRPALMAELGWTLAAVLLASATGGVILLVVWLTGGSVCIDDFQQQYLPGYLDMNRALREGSFPLLSLSSWFGGYLAGEYQYGVFSIAHLLIVLLVFQLGLGLSGTATTLIAIYTAILSSGAFRLGRRLGLTVPNAMMMCLAATLNGWMFYWGARTWFNAMTGCAWIPWAWWGLELSLDRRLGSWRFLPGAILLYLLLTGGWPYAILMIGLVTVWLCFRNWRLFWTGRIWPLFAAWTLGLAPGLARHPRAGGVQSLHRAGKRKPLDRGRSGCGACRWRLSAARSFRRCRPYWNAFGDRCLRDSCELFCGLAPCVALLAALVRWRMPFIREYRWELGLLVVVAILCNYGTGGPFRWAFRWLPLFHLVLGLLGGFALQRWSTAWKPMTPMPSGCGGPRARQNCRLVRQPRGVVVFACRRDDGLCLGHVAVARCVMYVVLTGLALFALSLAWLFADRRLSADSPVRVWIPVAFTALALIVGNYRSAHSVPAWQLSDSIREPGPIRQGENLSGDAELGQDIMERNASAKDRPMRQHGDVLGRVVRQRLQSHGHRALCRVIRACSGPAFTTLPQGETLLKNHLAAGHLLSQMGVDGLVLGPNFARYAELVKQSGWNPVRQLPLGTVFHRPGPPIPRVRSLTDLVLVKPDNQERVIEVVAWHGDDSRGCGDAALGALSSRESRPAALRHDRLFPRLLSGLSRLLRTARRFPWKRSIPCSLPFESPRAARANSCSSSPPNPSDWGS